jgi:hypothetical protein
MRRLAAAALLLFAFACAEAKLPPTREGKPSCPNSQATTCTSGPTVCGYDEAHDCNLCQCKSEVF